MDDAGLGHLQRLKKLRILGLSDTSVTNAGLVHLKGLTKLRELDLENTVVTDAGLGHLERLTDLQRLWLMGTKVTEGGIARLRQALPEAVILDAEGRPHRPGRGGLVKSPEPGKRQA